MVPLANLLESNNNNCNNNAGRVMKIQPQETIDIIFIN